MAIYFGLNTDTASSLFSSLSSSNSSTNQTFSLLGDYASIKSGSYKKLLSAYYALDSDSQKASTTNTKLTEKLDSESWKEVASDISSLKSSADTLIETEITEENRSDIEKEISTFVKSYNEVLDSSSDVSSSSLSKKTEWMTRITGNYSDALEKIGITVKEDDTLSLDSEVLSKASLKDIESVFSDSYSYAGQVNSAVNLMAQVASNSGSSNTASLYTSSGTYSNLSSSSLYDILF
ncbi:MAG: hypothetical protein IJA36_08280 [Lachnospiraceae bacterium]|nr:hypothetical protein [Lachnospiraceae bacterium]